jgi:hypothetical protein
LALARSSGGEPPLPAPPGGAHIEDLRARVGNDQLAGIRDREADLDKHIADWIRAKALVDARLPVWELTDRLAHHARGLGPCAEPVEQIEAIRGQRLLLESTDPVAPLRRVLTDALRQALADAHKAFATAYGRGIAALEGSTHWARLPAADRKGILAAVGLAEMASPNLATDAALVAALDGKPLSSWQAETDAVPGRVQKALEQAARLLLPKVRPVSIERSTLVDVADVDAWLERQKKTLVTAIKDGPVLVS